ncbi:PAC2 family protein [Chloroflexota bacterium]
MGIRITKRPKLNHPDLIACWPGIGNVGIIAADTLRRQTGAKELGYIEPWDFFYPQRVSINKGQLVSLEFPRCNFFYSRTKTRDLIFFLAGEQPSNDYTPYASGTKAYQMANMVLDVAQKFGCGRIYTSGAAVTQMHHTARSQVWAVPNTSHLLDQLGQYENTVIMSDIESKVDNVRISGMNGIMIGVAGTRGIDGICLMGEVPVYLQGLPFAYPNASKSVIEVMRAIWGLDVDFSRLDRLSARIEKEVERLYTSLPGGTKELIDRLAQSSSPTDTGPITEEDKKYILDEIDRFFNKEEED